MTEKDIGIADRFYLIDRTISTVKIYNDINSSVLTIDAIELVEGTKDVKLYYEVSFDDGLGALFDYCIYLC